LVLINFLFLIAFIFLQYLICTGTHRKKFEIATDEEGNPIKQDEKKGVLREFKKGDIFFNYGCLPVSTYYLLSYDKNLPNHSVNFQFEYN